MQIQTVAAEGSRGYERHVAITRDYEGLSDSVSDYAGPHIARWDPARVLAECEAKRQLIERVGNPDWAGFRILALPYADHPDYQQEWKP